jgi:pyruvate,water dikinase
MSLLAGIEPPVEPAPHAVATLDWWYPTGPTTSDSSVTSVDHAAVIRAREDAERAAADALRSDPRRLRTFQRLLAETQHLVPIREEQARELTLGWPVMRRAVLRIGQALHERKLVGSPEDVFFLARSEVLAALESGEVVADDEVAARRALRDEQARLVPPAIVGHMPPMGQKMVEGYTRTIGGVRSDRSLVFGTPASPGRATGSVRVIHGPEQFDDLLPGEILVAPITAPAWTPLFTRAAAVVTDVGSAAAHASIIAREYGIPAIVGCVDATARLRTGMVVTVDGSTGNVEAA